MARPELLLGLLAQGIGARFGKCDTGMGASTTAIVCADLAGFPNDYFNVKFYMTIIHNDNSVGNAPEYQTRQITDYVSSSGTFTTAAFGANVEEEDEIMVIHESIALLGLHADATLAKMVDDSWLAHILAEDGDVSAYDDTTMSLEALASAIAAISSNPRLTGEYVADGAITKGDFIGITSAGEATKVGVASEMAISPSYDWQTPIEVDDGITIGGTSEGDAVWLTTTKCVQVYADAAGGQDLYVAVGNVQSDGTITWETPEDTTLTTVNSQTIKACRVEGYTNKIAVAYMGTDNDGFAVVISFTGDAINTVGTPVEWYDATTMFTWDIVSPATDVIVVGGGASGGTYETRASAVSGTAISGWDVAVAFNGAAKASTWMRMCVLDSTHIAYLYSDANTTNAMICSLSTTTLTKGSDAEMGSDDIVANMPCNIMTLSEGTITCIFVETATPQVLTVSSATWSGTAIDSNINETTRNVHSANYTWITSTQTGPNTALVYTTAAGTSAFNTITLIGITTTINSNITQVDASYIFTAAAPVWLNSTEDDTTGTWSLGGKGTDSDLYATNGCLLGTGFFQTPNVDVVKIDGLLGIAEENISDTATGTICTYGVPTASTKTGMSEEQGWYSTGDLSTPLVLKTRDGQTGLYATPLTTVNLNINPAEAGDNSWI